jgi:hypothetical protein
MAKKGNWIVMMERVVRTEVICDDCTEEEVNANPWDHATSETDLDQIDWEVISVGPNE